MHPEADDGAIIAGAYRYLLWRTWDAARPRQLWILLNPSTADAWHDDPTLRRCIHFSRAWGYGGLEVVNLFALRATHPRDLRTAMHPIGAENDRYLIGAARRAAGIMAAWGTHGAYMRRDRAVLALLAPHAAHPLHCLGVARNGCPRHPQRLPAPPALSPTRCRPGPLRVRLPRAGGAVAAHAPRERLMAMMLAAETSTPMSTIVTQP